MRFLVLSFLCLLPLWAGEPLRVLMIGNSYTAQTQKMTRGFLEADPEVELVFALHVPNGSFLEQHAKNPDVEELLEKEVWDVVILQEQSQLPAFAMNDAEGAKEKLAAGAPVLIKKIRKACPGARILLFQTWSRHQVDCRKKTLTHFDGEPAKMQEALVKGYEWIKEQGGEGIEIVPVGLAFERWYSAKGYEDEQFTLHKRDRTHPGPLGAYLTGAVFYGAITGRDPSGVEFTGQLQDEELRKALRACVSDVP